MRFTVADLKSIKENILQSLDSRHSRDTPYQHWLLDDLLPEEDGREVADLPFTVPDIEETGGKRETNNSLRQFFSEENREKFPVVDRVSTAFQSTEVVRAIESSFDVTLSGNFLRIEFCQDTEHFWLEPHTDIGAKKFTLLVGYSDSPEGEEWGTSIYYDRDRFYEQSPFGFNKGLVFVPSDRTWHGFEKRRITGIRRSIIINYVVPEWRSRHELAFPSTVVS